MYFAKELHSAYLIVSVWFCLFSISAQSNFAVGAVVNATFGSITEMTFYITALLRGHRAATKCYEEIVKSALAGTLIGCILFIPVSVIERNLRISSILQMMAVGVEMLQSPSKNFLAKPQDLVT